MTLPPPLPRQSAPEDLKALFDVCQRLGGFESRISFEWLDGALTALLAGPRLVPFDEWAPLLLGDAFERTFADPDDAAQARRVIELRSEVIHAQLYHEALADYPDQLRLSPQLHDYSGVTADEGAGEVPLEGELWAEGFGDAVQAFEHDWNEPDLDTELGEFFAGCLDRISALMLDPEALAKHLEEYYPGQSLSRDDLIDEACFAVQDLRVYWSDALPPPEPRHVDKGPGRNDPCPCGSGLKFKKCHGR